LEQQFPAFKETFLDTWTEGFTGLLQSQPVPEQFKRELEKIAEKAQEMSKEARLAEIVVNTSHYYNIPRSSRLPHMNNLAKRSCSMAWAHTGCLWSCSWGTH
jgi:hypothetical protein